LRDIETFHGGNFSKCFCAAIGALKSAKHASKKHLKELNLISFPSIQIQPSSLLFITAVTCLHRR